MTQAPEEDKCIDDCKPTINPENVAEGYPTKDFFISMLTRDIALNDAILDLLDNCLDGVVRTKGIDTKQSDKKYYAGFEAQITITNDSFKIEDNCGGIPRDVAEKKAFRMGRADYTDNGLPTVGIYGIGMKRAIFKIGKEATVLSKHKEHTFSVKIPKNWAKNESWNFPIEDVSKDVLDNDGASISITQLTEAVTSKWSKKEHLEDFVSDLISSIQASYSFIIERGFKIVVNGKLVSALPIQLLISKEKDGIKPYIFEKQYDDVKVQLVVGFYAPPPSDDEIDENNESKRSSSDAGWTVVCNDRVVLYNDRTHLTGWGEAGVPQYHTQFIGIRGIVVFESNNPEKLPMTTTKRGIDLSSPIYAAVKNIMREGLQMFTSYTNRWKGRKEQERVYSASAEKISYTSVFENKEGLKNTHGIDFRKKDNASIFQPALPKPPNDKNYVYIRFTKPKEEIDALTYFFYEDDTVKINPSDIGSKCFDIVLKEAKDKK